MVNLDLPILNRVKNILTKTEKIDTDIASVLTKLAEQGVDIDSIITNIGTSGDQASAATIFGKLAGLASQSGGAVKSVQRSVVTFNNTENKTITINNININKTFVLIDNSSASNWIDSGITSDNRPVIYVGQTSTLQSLSSNSVVITPSYQIVRGRYSSDTKYNTVSIQIIEFN